MSFKPAPAPQAQRILDFARSEVFERTFKEGMALVDETAAYLDGPGRAAAKRLSRLGALAYAGESLRLTTRLMQLASWLLVQRALRDGEMALGEAAHDKYRLAARAPAGVDSFAGADEVPEALQALGARGAALYERVMRLDAEMYESPIARRDDVNDRMARLAAAFAEA